MILATNSPTNLVDNAVYKVPPRTSNEGFKAASWNDQGMLWKGRIRVLEIGDRCEIRLEVGVTEGSVGSGGSSTWSHVVVKDAGTGVLLS